MLKETRWSLLVQTSKFTLSICEIRVRSSSLKHRHCGTRSERFPFSMIVKVTPSARLKGVYRLCTSLTQSRSRTLHLSVTGTPQRRTFMLSTASCSITSTEPSALRVLTVRSTSGTRTRNSVSRALTSLPILSPLATSTQAAILSPMQSATTGLRDTTSKIATASRFGFTLFKNQKSSPRSNFSLVTEMKFFFAACLQIAYLTVVAYTVRIL
mmetsp:Transcript_45390/g.120748  ORF Transcript_45390/g.120748 Transcript_45390/m.120748 type:complete len:212 (+) Transcript_45390:460-1095(+)